MVRNVRNVGNSECGGWKGENIVSVVRILRKVKYMLGKNDGYV